MKSSNAKKPKLLFFTNLSNGSPDEDTLLSKELGKIAEVLVMHPIEYLDKPCEADGAIIRNIWPTHEYRIVYEQFARKLLESGIKTLNPITGKGDSSGKDYLTEIYQTGYLVIPSIDNMNDIARLPEANRFFIKPKYSCDGIGSKILSRSELEKENLGDMIIQPYLEFESEPSFFFIDNQFAYAVITSHRIKHEVCKSYFPPNEEIEFAEQFVKWNNLPYGIQRIDAVKLKDGKLLLTEVEDLCPYLYLLEIDDTEKEKVLEKILLSMKKNLGF